MWLRDPLPEALFEADDRPYRVVSASHSLLGLIAVAPAGLAFVGLVESCLPPSLVHVGEAERLPPPPVLELRLDPGPGEPLPVMAQPAEFLTRAVRGD